MASNRNRWMDSVARFFDKHPEREFYLGTATVLDFAAASEFWAIGFASRPMSADGWADILVPSRKTPIPVIVRRADPAGDGVPYAVVIDGVACGGRLPVFRTKGAARSREEEQFAARVWEKAGVAAKANVPLLWVLAASGLLRDA